MYKTKTRFERGAEGGPGFIGPSRSMMVGDYIRAESIEDTQYGGHINYGNIRL